MVKAISPGDVPTKKKADLPAFVLDEWNKIIAEKSSSGGSVRIMQDDIIERLLPHTAEGTTNGSDWAAPSRQVIFANHWLDIEPIYEEAGWKVVYDKPGYNEDYKASFRFTPPSKPG
jgi:hypothetical protein